MSQPTVAAEIHQPLDVHGHLAPKVALDDVVAVDDLADLQHLLVGQLRHPPGIRDSDFRHDFIGLFRPDPVDILQCNNDAFVGRYVDAGDAGHSYSLLLQAQAQRPAPLCPPDLAVLAFVFNGLRAAFLTPAVRAPRRLGLASLGAGVLARICGDLAGGFLAAAPRSTRSMALPTCGIGAIPSTERSTL